MYKMIKAISNTGTDKLPEIAAMHSLEGDLDWIPYTNYPFFFVYNDDSGKMMRSSAVQETIIVDGQIRFRTLNSEYWFEHMED